MIWVVEINYYCSQNEMNQGDEKGLFVLDRVVNGFCLKQGQGQWRIQTFR